MTPLQNSSPTRAVPISPRGPRRSWRGHVLLLTVPALLLGLGGCAAVDRVVEALPTGAITSAEQPALSGEIGDADGFIAPGELVDPWKDTAAIGGLDPNLREAMRSAATEARAAGVTFGVTSGWRSVRYQESLLSAAITRYGSEAEARKWVSTAEDSKHVSGEAVDIGYTDANSWLSQHGADYGLCQAYANESWHFELLTEPGGVCPVQRSDAATG